MNTFVIVVSLFVAFALAQIQPNGSYTCPGVAATNNPFFINVPIPQAPNVFDTHCDLTGKNILVTGATTGVGRSLALTYVQFGANVIGTSRHPHLWANITEYPLLKMELSNFTSIDNMVDTAFAMFNGTMDVLVSNAAQGSLARILLVTSDQLETMLRWTFLGQHRIINRVLGIVGPSTTMRIQCTWSIASYAPTPFYSAYSVGKYGGRLAIQLGLNEIRSIYPNVTMVGIYPDGMDTNFFNNMALFPPTDPELLAVKAISAATTGLQFSMPPHRAARAHYEITCNPCPYEAYYVKEIYGGNGIPEAAYSSWVGQYPEDYNPAIFAAGFPPY